MFFFMGEVHPPPLWCVLRIYFILCSLLVQVWSPCVLSLVVLVTLVRLFCTLRFSCLAHQQVSRRRELVSCFSVSLASSFNARRLFQQYRYPSSLLGGFLLTRLSLFTAYIRGTFLRFVLRFFRFKDQVELETALLWVPAMGSEVPN